MINYTLLKEVLRISFISSIIITNLVQSIKVSTNIKNSNICVFISLVVSFVIGILFSLSFSNLGFVNCIWTGLFSFIHSDILYKLLENKAFKSLSYINSVEE